MVYSSATPAILVPATLFGFLRWNLFFSESEGFQKEFLVLFLMILHPLFSRLFPGKLPPLLAFNPFIFTNLFLDKVSDSIKGVRQHHRRNLDVLLGI